LTWLKVDDGLPFDPKMLSLGRTKREVNESVGTLVRLWSWCAQQGTDGFVLAAVVDMVATPECVRRVTQPAFGRKAALHRRGDKCDCLEGRPWTDGAEYAVHDFLDRNPSREETDVARAKKRELRNGEVKAAVYDRDGRWCRYCAREVNPDARRGETRRTLDHVDPRIANGAENLVVCCGACNPKKKDRSPEAAGMRLLPPPSNPKHPHHAEWMAERASTGFDTGLRTDSKPDSERTQNQPGSGLRTVSETVPDPPPPKSEPKQDPTSADATATLLAAFPGATQDSITVLTQNDLPDGSGRDGPGKPVVGGSAIGPPSTRRDSLHPNPYLRSAITGPGPDEHAGLAPVAVYEGLTRYVLPPPPEEETPWTN
jgi:5-methylcytosine-specific restriction endonuclease McrA